MGKRNRGGGEKRKKDYNNIATQHLYREEVAAYYFIGVGGVSRFLSVVSIGNNNNFLELDEIFKKKIVVKEEHF